MNGHLLVVSPPSIAGAWGTKCKQFLNHLRSLDSGLVHVIGKFAISSLLVLYNMINLENIFIMSIPVLYWQQSFLFAMSLVVSWKHHLWWLPCLWLDKNLLSQCANTTSSSSCTWCIQNSHVRHLCLQIPYCLNIIHDKTGWFQLSICQGLQPSSDRAPLVAVIFLQLNSDMQCL